MAATKDSDYIGYQTKIKCPICDKGLLFTNKKGNQWCSSTDCNYHVDYHGKPRRVIENPIGKFRY